MEVAEFPILEISMLSPNFRWSRYTSGYGAMSSSDIPFNAAISPSTPFLPSKRRYSERRTANWEMELSSRISTINQWPSTYSKT